jgi:ABC-2 type transport system ATP-binding protein
MIQISGVTKKFGDHKVLNDISIHIKKGTIHGIIGENGAGKSTVLQCLAGIYGVDGGSILVEGEEVYENNAAKREIGYVADRNQFFKSYTVKEMVQFFKWVYPHFSEDKFRQYNESFKLDLQARVKNLSKGMQMRLNIMLSLASSPKILILDEPTSGLDVIAKRMMLDFLIEEVSSTGLTVIISSHHIMELEKICDQVTIMHQGQVAYQASVDDLKGKVKKLQVLFEEAPPQGMDQWDEIVKLDQIGSVYYIVTDQYSKAFENKLKEQGAKMIEHVGLDLEEVFIYTSQKKEKQKEGSERG